MEWGVSSRVLNHVRECNYPEFLESTRLDFVEYNLNWSKVPVKKTDIDGLYGNISIHAPITYLKDQFSREPYSSFFKEFLLITRDIGKEVSARYINFHAYSRADLEEAAELLGKETRVCIENNSSYYLYRLPDIMVAAEEFDLGITLDIGHALVAYKDPWRLVQAIRDSGISKNVSVMHVHDNHATMDEHKAVGDGMLGVEITKTLIDICEPNYIVIETATLEDAMKSFQRLGVEVDLGTYQS